MTNAAHNTSTNTMTRCESAIDRTPGVRVAGQSFYLMCHIDLDGGLVARLESDCGRNLRGTLLAEALIFLDADVREVQASWDRLNA